MPEQIDVADADAAPPAPDHQVPIPTTPGVVPGRTLGVVGFALSLLALTNLVGLVLSIIALVKSRRAGHGNGFAIAGIVIAGAGIALAAVILALTVPVLVDAAQTCARLGDGVHQVGHSTYTCTPTSFHVSTRLG